MKTLVGASLLFLLVNSARTQGNHCPGGWTFFQDSCYLVVHQPDTWFEARVTCQVLHGHLVTIDSDSENNFVANMMQKESVTEAWIGLLDVAVENQFVWTTNEESPEYTNWYHGQPDNASGNEDCVELRTDWGDHSMHWNDNNCHVTINFVCERPLPGEITNGEIIG